MVSFKGSSRISGSKITIKGHLLWKIHFHMVFEHKCVLAVCEQNHPRMIKIHPVFFLQSQ